LFSEGDFAEYVTSFLELYNGTHYIYFYSNATATLRWEVIREMDDVVELVVSLNATGIANISGIGTSFNPYDYDSWLNVYKNITLTVNVSSREAKYMGQDIGYTEFWIDKMPSKDQRIPMFRNNKGEMLYGEIFSISPDHLPFNGKKIRPVILEVLNPDPNDFIYTMNYYDWYSGLAITLMERGGSQEFEPGAVRVGTLNGSEVEVLKFGEMPLGKLLSLGSFNMFRLNSTSIRIGSPSEQDEIDVSLVVAVGFFAASGIFIAYVLLRQRLKPGGE
ncbi:MAG: hypothetical protein QW542_07510, partial [Thermoproteota archaeon]